MSSAVPLSSLPTVSDLYRNESLRPEAASEPRPQASTSINARVSLIRTSITTLATTCIVNAANESLLGGGGVDGAIHAAAGPRLLKECRTLNGCPTGLAKITRGYDLPSKYVIHAVGPIYWRAKKASSDHPAQLLRSCYNKSLALAAKEGGSVAFSCLSTGVYGYPPEEAAEVACETVREFLEGKEGEKLERVVFCCFETKDEKAYVGWIPKIFPPTQEELPQAEEKAKNGTDEIEKDWEAVDKPSEAASEKAPTDISEEGEKVEAPDLGADDGEKVEKPSVTEPVDELAESGEVLPKSGLMKDW